VPLTNQPTGSIACCAALVIQLLGGDIELFSPHRGDTLHRWGEIWCLGVDPTPSC